ncbi:MAG TPA: acyl-CoA dehydrogenase family protein, partial [Micromonosporaceae bacterium]
MRAELDLPEFTAKVCSWIAEHAPDGLVEVFDWRLPRIVGNRDEARRHALDHPLFRQWEQTCLAAGAVCASWPEQFGGRGWSRRQRAVFEAELHAHGLPKVDRDLGESLVGPTVIAWGTPEQQARLLPPIITGRDVYCQGFSEPNNGSDLAGLRTAAVRDGDELVVTGQKVWTTHALEANKMILLCRTDSQLPRHKGLTFVVLDFSPENNVEVRPIRQMSGPAEFAEVFLTGARARCADIIGGLNNGWLVAMTTLAAERDFNIPTLALENEYEFGRLVARVAEQGRSNDPAVRQVLAEAYSRMSVMRHLGDRILSDPDGAETEPAI